MIGTFGTSSTTPFMRCSFGYRQIGATSAAGRYRIERRKISVICTIVFAPGKWTRPDRQVRLPAHWILWSRELAVSARQISSDLYVSVPWRAANCFELEGRDTARTQTPEAGASRLVSFSFLFLFDLKRWKSLAHLLS